MKISELIEALQRISADGAHDWEVAIEVHDSTGGSGHAPVGALRVVPTAPYNESDFSECFVLELQEASR